MEKTLRSSEHVKVDMDEQLKFSPRPCWTCRKNRVKCDGRLPTCFKCRMKGRECLGYSANKPLVWTGLAGRGKIAHQNFGHQKRESFTTQREPTSPTQLIPTPRPLTDPIFQGLSPRSGQYISYYIHRCCVDCTIYEPHAPNRFKQFLALMPGNPVLFHSILAIAAFHQARSASCAYDALPEPTIPEQPLLITKINHSNDSASPQYSDAITHSARSISALRESLANAADSLDALLATVFILIWLDTVDSGTTIWKQHLEGLRGLILLQRGSRLGATDLRVKNASSSPLRAFFEETFAMLSLLGSTFDPGLPRPLDVFPQSELDQVFVRTESHSWTGCPSNLLCILHCFLTSALSKDRPPPRVIYESFARLQQFDTANWAARCPQPSLAPVRFSLGESWKGAIEIYGRRVLGVQYPDLRRVSEDLIETTLSHLRQISHHDTHFKGTVWPAFVVGAEARTAEQREAILSIYGHLIELSHVSMFRIAIAQMRRIWARSTPYPPGSSWVHEIWERKEGLLLL
ncbi:fungal-specific transcription factor domain-containing protein [Hypoxylon sp. FL0890]|nr:fungal-specific transcription factor domain-containing protein [Hypoxylon sp. FL0890]